MVDGDINIDYGRSNVTTVSITSPDHPMAAQLSSPATIYSSDSRAAWAKPAGGADIIASLTEDEQAAVLFVYEKNAQMVNGTAPAPRVGLFVQDNSAADLTIPGWKLFDAAIDYAQATTVAVSKNELDMPNDFRVYQNYPNPFNPSTTISFDLPSQSDVSIKIINASGQIITTLLEKSMSAGRHTVQWDGVNQDDYPVSSGIYFARLQMGEQFKVIKLSLIR